MSPNPLLKKLNLPEDGRAIIIHADDIGICQSSITAYRELLDAGLISSASTIVPCPWFPGVAEFCRSQVDSELDMGIHLNLNSGTLRYRWGPISTCDPSSGLLDQTGYFHAAPADTHANGDPKAVKIELRAQIERALSAGIDVTHVDSDWGTLYHPKFIDGFIEVAQETNILPLLFRPTEDNRKQTDVFSDHTFQKTMAMEQRGFPTFDHIRVMPHRHGLHQDQHENRVETALGIIESLPAGVAYFVLHPARDTPELRAMDPDWRVRAADYQAFTSSELGEYIKRTGISVISWRTLRDLMAAE